MVLACRLDNAGFLSKDKAILTNFGLQIPLFLIGFYQLLF